MKHDASPAYSVHVSPCPAVRQFGFVLYHPCSTLIGEIDMNLERMYKKSLDEQWCLRLKTDHPDGGNYDGVVTQISKDFVVICQEEAFQFDGIVILPKKFITGCRDNKYDRCCNEILRMNGAIKKCRQPEWLQGCETIWDVFAVIESTKRNIWPTVEIVWDKRSKGAFYLG